MKTIKLAHLTQESLELTINKCENEDVLFYLWPNTTTVVIQYSFLQGWDLFSHLVRDETHIEQWVTSEDKEQLEMKSYTL